ncbi:hypothetical protein GDO86_007062, partial [Hymenochirus boettgeri]
RKPQISHVFSSYQLSVTDIMLSTSVGPNLLSALLMNGKTMSVSACVTQFLVSGFFTGLECFLLTIMSYDRYLAICNPLHYVNIMTSKHSFYLVMWSWIIMFFIVLIQIIATCHSGFCGCNTIDYIYCDYAPLLEIFCSDTFIVEILRIILSIPVVILPLWFIITSYIRIIFSTLRISTSTGRQKAFSTCTSHLTVVCTYYGILIGKYSVPSKGQSLNGNKIISLIYTMVTPLFNPIIYSFRNREIQRALRKMDLCNIVGVKNYRSGVKK